MKIIESVNKRNLRHEEKEYDLVVIGGGMSGVCCAITAARQGVRTALINARPVLGGNTSSEYRVWALGATSHMGNNNRWSREGGVIDEILVENTYRNKEGNPVLFDTVLIDKVLAEKNIDLYLNTVVSGLEKINSRTISEVFAFNPYNQIEYTFKGRFFVDCSGDGIAAFLAGASYRVGAEDKEEFNEGFAPDIERYGELLGHSILLYTRDTGEPVKYVAPDFALKHAEQKIARLSNSNYLTAQTHGCKYWWIEYGGRLDTVHDTEQIKYELWKVVYGIWDYMKNSGKYPELETYTLEWVGLLPGKRESRRYMGHYMLTQQDVIQQISHYDDVAFGGWSIDLHPSDGVYSKENACNQWHSKGVYAIPYRCYVSKDLDNLWLCGRLISASHVAQGSSRVMCTAAHGGQAVGMAAALCVENNYQPADLLKEANIVELQRRLIASGQYIPGLRLGDFGGLVTTASISSSSTLELSSVKKGNTSNTLTYPAALLLPLRAGQMPKISVEATLADKADSNILSVELRTSERADNFTPEVVLKKQQYILHPGKQDVEVDFGTQLEHDGYYFICFMTNPAISLTESNTILPGVKTVYNYQNAAVSNFGKQVAPEGIGVDSFEFWCPKRRPEGKLIAFRLSQAELVYSADNIKNELFRPVVGTNMWAASMEDSHPCIQLEWEKDQVIHNIRLYFDTDMDQALENVQMGHYDSVAPTCVRAFRIYDQFGKEIYREDNNHQTIRTIHMDVPLTTRMLRIETDAPSKDVPAVLAGIAINTK